MDNVIRIGDLVFDSSFLFAWRGTKELKFTRSERALLQAFHRNARRVLTRDQLLDAVSGSGSEASDRNIDYLINRLRAKLGDSARTPSLIATQYGEGYVWLAAPEKVSAPIEALLAIGPVFGLGHLAAKQQARGFLIRLQAALDAQTASDQAILLDEAWDAAHNAPGRVRFSLDVSFHSDSMGLHCAAVLREVSTKQMLQVLRVTLPDGLQAPPDIWAIAASLKSTMWRRLTLAQGSAAIPQDEPLELRMHGAGLLLSRSDQSWLEGGAQLAGEREKSPDDPLTCLMWAMHLYSRIILSFPNTPCPVPRCDAVTAEIEALVLDHLPALQDNPIHLLGAAKLLVFTGRGHIGLAAQLAEQAFASSAAFAAAFSVLGQIRMYMGDTDAAVALYDKGLELSEPDSHFRIYLMLLKLAALLASGDRPALDTACAQLYAQKPLTRRQIGLYYASPDQLPDDLKLHLDQFNLGQARRALSYGHYTSVRLFEREDHRENLLRGVVSHIVSRFGLEAVPDQVWQAAPRLAREHFGPSS